MRHGLTMLVAGAALVMSGCGSNGQADLAANAGSGLTADKITANDVTAIDAVTGEAANMAADVDFTNLTDNQTEAGGNSTKPAAAPTPKASTAPTAKPSPAQPPEPAEPANTTE